MMKPLSLGGVPHPATRRRRTNADFTPHGVMSDAKLGPVIALLSQALIKGSSYAPASYVKWLEMAGARVTLVPYDSSDEAVDKVFNNTNGVLFIGGGSDTPRSARRFYKNTIAAHAAGDTYPIWGTCDGFEWLMQIGANDDSVLTGGFDSENISLPLNLTAAAHASRLFADAAGMPIQGSGLRQTVLQAFATLPITLNNHQQGVTPHDFARSALARSFDVLATNVERKGKAFVSVVEARGGVPVWGTQFHPEKNIFEQSRALPSDGWWPFEHIAHSRAAVAASQYMANFFVDQCRASTHRYADAAEEWDALVYNRTTTTTMAPGFAQVYTFPDGEA